MISWISYRPMDTLSNELLERIAFLTLWILLAGGGSIYFYRHPELIDKPNDGWFGKLTRNPPEEREERYRMIRKRLLWNIPIVLITTAILVRDLYVLALHLWGQ